MSHPFFSFNRQWRGKCFVCNQDYPEYNTGKLLCEHCKGTYQTHPFFTEVSSKLHHYFATVLPETDVKKDLLLQNFSDTFLRKESGRKKWGKDVLKKSFPSLTPLPCGQPALVKMDKLADFSGFKQVWTLDASPYIWSGTYKDLRSLAILSKAIEHNIRHLALWTAGNAGYSLAKMVHRHNATVSDKSQRKTVYCLVGDFAPPEIVVTLRSLQYRVAPISTGKGAILSREHMYNVVASMAGDNISQEGYWQVTDGWDGIGTFMYSLLAQQAFYFLKSELEQSAELKSANIYIVLPLGTGNCLLGFIKAMNRVGEGRAKIISAMPYEDNMMSFLKEKTGEAINGRTKMRRNEPEAEKLTGFYSPLSPCLYTLWQKSNPAKDGYDFSDFGQVEFVSVDRSEQIEAAARILGYSEFLVASEPSALVSFGALKTLAEKVGDNLGNSVALVVNSGFGLMGIKEQEFFTKSIFAFR